MSHAQPTAVQASERHADGRRGVRPQSYALSDDSMDASAIGPDAVDTATSNTKSSPRHVRFPDDQHRDSVSGASSAIASLTSQSTLETLSTRLDLSPTEKDARKGLLRESFFGHWKDDASHIEADTPEEMQKNDPLGTQIWKLYHKTKGQLPNSERLENLTWRMMSMNLRRKQLAESQRYTKVVFYVQHWPCTDMCAQPTDSATAHPARAKRYCPASQVVPTSVSHQR